MSDTRLDLAAARIWLGAIHGQSPGHLLICSTGDWAGRAYTTSQIDQALDYIAHLDSAGREGIYLRITSVSTLPEAGKRGSAADSAALPALWADLDLAGPGHELWCADDCQLQHAHVCPASCTTAHQHITRELPPDEAAGRAIIAASGLPEPTIWVHSGGGLYPIWLLEKPWPLNATNLPDAKRLAKDWQRVIEHAAASLGWYYGRGVGDLARVLRIPGTVNRKEGLARPCRILSAQNLRYTPQQLVDALDAAIARIAPPDAGAKLGEVSAKLPSPVGQVARPDRDGLSPLDDFAARTAWADILNPAGWHEHYQQDDVTYWTRPGKTTGTSASTNALGTDRLFVFTTAAAPLDGGESYSKGGAYAALHHGGDHSAAARELAAKGFGTPLPDPAEEHRQALTEILGSPLPELPPLTKGPSRTWRAEIDVSNPAEAADWLRDEAGQGRLSGLFRRIDAVVHTPLEGEEGYVPLGGDADEDGPAQVRPVTDSTLSSRITYTYGLYRMVKKGEDFEPKQAMFPRSAARTALDVPDMLPNLRTLRGVVHSPVFRPDGTVLAAPGYDHDTGLLHLPEPGLTVPRVSDEPPASEVTDAVKLLDEMLAGFPFVSEHYRANYLGMLITPLLRAMYPPPYKLHAIEAHQPGSGKTLLANLSRIIHGGVFRAEMPEGDEELRKQVTSILTVTTGPVVVIDNVSGALKSSTLAGLLTTDQWDDRPLGSTNWTRAHNDRLWTITGNNLSIGGDLPRRTIRTAIDPGMPNPEKRTGFAIGDLEGWTKNRRGDLLHALLTIVRAWVVAGRPMPPEHASDGYARWTRALEGILGHAGIKGGFDHPSTQIAVGTDDDEWALFLAAVHQAYGSDTWTAKALLSDINTGGLVPTGTIPVDALPGELGDKAARHPSGPAGISKSLGRWLSNRVGRWAGGLAVKSAGENRDKVKLWQIVTTEAAGEA